LHFFTYLENIFSIDHLVFTRLIKLFDNFIVVCLRLTEHNLFKKLLLIFADSQNKLLFNLKYHDKELSISFHPLVDGLCEFLKRNKAASFMGGFSTIFAVFVSTPKSTFAFRADAKLYDLVTRGALDVGNFLF
jgi:hypothetical protein